MMKQYSVIFVCLLFHLFSEVQSAKILCLNPSPSKSHLIITNALVKGLVEKGHDVTFVSSYPLMIPLKNYRNVHIPVEPIPEELIYRFLAKNMSMATGFPIMNQMTCDASNSTINSPEFKRIMAEEKFDLIIYGYFVNAFLFGLSYHFKCPSIVQLPIGPVGIANAFIGNPIEVAAVPQLLLGYKEPMTFLQRTANFLATIVERIVINFSESKQKQYYDSNFPAGKFPPYETAIRNISLILANDHFSQGMLRPNLPNVIEVGGLQVKTKPDPLPQEIQSFLDEAEHGVIYFSLGSNLKSHFLGDDKVKAILRTFSKMKQHVVFKWETDTLPGKPDNVLIGKWLPQDDILAHKNVRLFVSHGGLGGVAEAKYHGVPIVGIPVFGDQRTNMHRIETEGWAVSVDYEDLTEASFSAAVHEILENPKYRQQLKVLSDLYRDRPQTALDTAIYWVEYVIRHKGALHMRYQGVNLNLFQATSIDVIAFLCAIVYAVVKLCKTLCKCLFCRRRQVNVKSKVN